MSTASQSYYAMCCYHW